MHDDSATCKSDVEDMHAENPAFMHAMRHIYTYIHLRSVSLLCHAENGPAHHDDCIAMACHHVEDMQAENPACMHCNDTYIHTFTCGQCPCFVSDHGR